MTAYENAAVATDQELCSKIGTHVLRELNGTAADAAVAVALSRRRQLPIVGTRRRRISRLLRQRDERIDGNQF